MITALSYLSCPVFPSPCAPDVSGPPRGSAAPPRSPSGEALCGRRPGTVDPGFSRAFPMGCGNTPVGFPWENHGKNHGQNHGILMMPWLHHGGSRLGELFANLPALLATALLGGRAWVASL